MRLPQYAKRIKAGGVNVRPNIRVVQERAAMALIDGDNGMGHLVMERAARALAIEKARTAASPGSERNGATTPGRRRCTRACRWRTT